MISVEKFRRGRLLMCDVGLVDVFCVMFFVDVRRKVYCSVCASQLKFYFVIMQHLYSMHTKYLQRFIIVLRIIKNWENQSPVVNLAAYHAICACLPWHERKWADIPVMWHGAAARAGMTFRHTSHALVCIIGTLSDFMPSSGRDNFREARWRFAIEQLRNTSRFKHISNAQLQAVAR